MKYAVRIGPASRTQVSRTVEIECSAGGRIRVQLDDKIVEAGVIALSADSYSILVGALVYEARISAGAQGGASGLVVRCNGHEFSAQVLDPRAWSRERSGEIEAQGRQRVAAPMPGKVVRVLVAAGDAVETGQGLVVVEAMKMQNEIRAPKNGIVERVFVSEGQTVTAGEALVIIG